MSLRPPVTKHAVIGRLFLAGIGCLLGIATPQAFSQSPAPDSVGRTLTFAERVAYQYAVEEVFWSHRIWPTDNPEPKPPLDAVISPEEVEKKVNDYLCMSQLLAEQWQRPITPGQLQAEMDRMASHTKESEVLRELFEALGNDPFVIAECLARPVAAERMLAERKGGSSAPPLDAKANREAITNFWPPTFATIARGAADPPDTAYKVPEIANTCANDSWTATSTVNAPDAREYHTAVWTGSEMLIWGGSNSDGGHVNSLNTGCRYTPSTDSWAATAIANAPLGRGGHTAVWTGGEMIIWGGANYPTGPLNTGGRYNPITDSWTATSVTNTPAARHTHTAVWTGNDMIVWGGRNNSSWMNSGGRYNPGTDSWTATTTMNAPAARWNHRALWTSNEMIIWGGTDQTNYLHTGGRYNPASNSWTATGLTNVPIGRIAHTAVWTGSEMIVWGGVDESFTNDTNTGGRYNPNTDSWIATSVGNAPLPRDTHSAVWTGREMIAWGGESSSTQGEVNSGGRYNPANDSWTATSAANVPLARHDHTGVWTGNEMIVWGGVSFDLSTYFNTGGKYCAQPSTPTVQSAVSRKLHGTTGVFDVDLPLSGTPGIESRSGGATNDYTIVVTFLANVSVNGNPQAAVTSGIGSVGSGGVSNGGTVTISGNVVTIPLTNVANAQTIQVTLNNVNGSTNETIPMSILIGDTNGNGTVNASDVSQTKSRTGQAVDGTNFRSDVNANGTINATDVSLVKSAVGTGLQ